MRCYEVLMSGCDKLCRELKIVCLNVSSTKGRGVPGDVSQRNWSEHMGIETLAKLSVMFDFCIVCRVAKSG